MNHQFKTTNAALRHSLEKKGVYLPDHRKNKTSIHYMKGIMSGYIPYFLVNKINKVTVPLYDELKPDNIINKMKL